MIYGRRSEKPRIPRGIRIIGIITFFLQETNYVKPWQDGRYATGRTCRYRIFLNTRKSCLFYFKHRKLSPLITFFRFFSVPYALSKILDHLQNSTTVDLDFSLIIFFDANKTSRRYVEDMRTYFHADTREVSFEPKNEQRILVELNLYVEALIDMLEINF